MEINKQLYSHWQTKKGLQSEQSPLPSDDVLSTNPVYQTVLRWLDKETFIQHLTLSNRGNINYLKSAIQLLQTLTIVDITKSIRWRYMTNQCALGQRLILTKNTLIGRRALVSSALQFDVVVDPEEISLCFYISKTHGHSLKLHCRETVRSPVVNGAHHLNEYLLGNKKHRKVSKKLLGTL